MKKILLLMITSILYGNLLAQTLNKLSIDLNIGRFSKEIGIFEAEYYSNEFSFINGFNIGYTSSEKWQHFVGVRKLHKNINSGDGFSLESSAINGVEFRVGTKLSPKNDKKVFLSYGLEIFGEFSNHKGTYWLDYPPDYEINHRKNYVGVAPSLTFNVNLADRIVLFTDARFRFGRVKLNQRESTQISKELYKDRAYWLGVFEPVNSIGVKFKL